MKTKKLLSILMATTMTIGMFAPTVAFAQDLNQTNTQVVAETVVETQKPKAYITSDSQGYYPEENAICLELYFRSFIYTGNIKRAVDQNDYNVKLDMDTPNKCIIQEILRQFEKYNNIPADVLFEKNNITTEITIVSETSNGSYIISHLPEYNNNNTIKNAMGYMDGEDFKIEGIKSIGGNVNIGVSINENELLRDMKVNYDVKTEDGKVLTANEFPNLASNIDNLKISPKDLFSNNKYLNFDYLSEGSKFKTEDLVEQNIIMHLDYARYQNYGKLLNPNETSVDIVYDKQAAEDLKSMSFEEFLNKRNLKLCNQVKIDESSSWRNEYSVLDKITFDVNYVVKDLKQSYDAETGTMRSESSYEVVTEDGKILTNAELPNLPANNYEEKIDVNKELEDSLEFYEDNYLNTIDDDEIEEEQLNVHMVLNDGNVFDILIDEDDDLYDDITIKELVESKGYKLEDVKEYSTKYVFVLDDDVFETDDDDEDDDDEFDEEDFEEDDDDEEEDDD